MMNYQQFRSKNQIPSPLKGLCADPTILKQVISERRSVRSYDPEKNSGNNVREILSALALDDGIPAWMPFKGDVHIRLREFDTPPSSLGSTYGVIRGATHFLVMTYGSDPADAIAAGYVMETIVLMATQAGLGTCWVGGTFNARCFGFEEGRNAVLVPVGYRADKPGLMARMMPVIARSRRRKPFGELFQCQDGGMAQPDNVIGNSLEMMRLAPSSLNSQPWRAIVDQGRGEVHFYCHGTSPLRMVDCGIGLCHFNMAELASGRGVGVYDRNPEAPELPDCEYVVSYTAVSS